MERIEKGRVLFTSLLLAIAVLFGALAAGFDPKPRLVPLSVSIAAILLGLPLLIKQFFPSRAVGMDRFKYAIDSEEVSQPRTKKASVTELQKILLWMAGFLALIFFLGFYIGIFLFTLAYLKFQARTGWPKALLVAGGLWFFIFFIFGKGMELDLFRGFLRGEIIPPL